MVNDREGHRKNLAAILHIYRTYTHLGRKRERERERQREREREKEIERALWKGYEIQAKERRSQASMVLVVVVLFCLS